MSGSGFGGDVGDALLLGIVGLCQGRVQLVGSGRRDTLILEIDVCRCAERGLKVISPYQRRASVAGVLFTDRFRDRNPLVCRVELLVGARLAEDRVEILGFQGLVGGRVEDRHWLVGHDCLHVEPCCRDVALWEQELFLSHFSSFLKC